MKRIFEYLGLAAIILFSFYYTEKAALLVQSKNPLMTEINSIAEEEKTDYVNAIIDGDTIIPGINGLEVNANKSFVKMKDFGAFNEYYLVYDEVKPKVSLEDNKSKIIIGGNKSKKSVSLIIDKNDLVKEFLENKGMEISVIAYEDGFEAQTSEMLNGEFEKIKYENVETLLNKSKKNTNICIIDTKNKELCEKNKKYLVKPSHYLSAANIVEIKNNIDSGNIILIKENARIDDVNLLIKQIEFKGLKIIKVSDLIKESKSQ